MLVEMRAHSQITLPNEIVRGMGIKTGDKFEVMARDGGVFLCPVAVYPKSTIDKLAQIMREHDRNESTVYDNVDDMFKDLGINLEDNDV